MKLLLLIWNISIIMSRVPDNLRNTSLICILFLARGGLTPGLSESVAAEWFIISSSWLLCVSAERTVGLSEPVGWKQPPDDTDETRTGKFTGHKTNINSTELGTIT